METFIRHTLFEAYGFIPQGLQQAQGGWSALAYAATTDKGNYFVKVYEKKRASTLPWIARMDAYMPAVCWLAEHTPLRDRMVAPVLTKHGAYKVENSDYVLVVFPFIDGVTLCESRLTPAQIRQLAETLALLHSHGSEIPVPTETLSETFALSFLDRLQSVLSSTLLHSLDHYTTTIKKGMDALRSLARELQANPPPFALCHTDIHGWNLMWHNERLLLIDWEGLQLASIEADLFSFTDGFFFDYANDLFVKAYMTLHPGFRARLTISAGCSSIHEPAMRFYRLRRRLEDISEFACSIAYDNLSPEETARSLRYLEKECIALAKGVS